MHAIGWICVNCLHKKYDLLKHNTILSENGHDPGIKWPVYVFFTSGIV